IIFSCYRSTKSSISIINKYIKVNTMIGYQQEQRSLTKEQKSAVGLLSIGTFLEYFDLMLYVHMAVFLNELFFPKSDPHNTAFYSATAFFALPLFLGLLVQ
ncbi:MAG: hypothetical protein ACE1S7_08455, partial [Candidatus Tisiphia sp.]